MPVSLVENIDCMEGMKEFPDKYFDLAVVDPPYGKNADLGTNGFGSARNRRYKSKWDGNTPRSEYFTELKRISKNQIIWGANYFIENLQSSNCFIVWDKKGEYKFQNPFADIELAYTSFNSVSKKITIIQQGFLNKNEIVIHPTQKPIELYDWIFKNYAKEGFKILDTHLGSGSSRISAYKAGLDFWGFELDADYFNKQEKRFKDFTSQLDAFRDAI